MAAALEYKFEMTVVLLLRTAVITATDCVVIN